MTPWLWRRERMPAREVEQLTLRQADAFVAEWERQQPTTAPKRT
ncbi:hypothetical protein [Catellatospora sp. NPDC049609]